MSETFPKDVQDTIFRMWDIIAAFAEDVDSTDKNGFYALVGEERKQDANLLIEYEVFKSSHDGSNKCAYCENNDLWFSLGSRGREAYRMIREDIMKPDSESQIYRLHPR